MAIMPHSLTHPPVLPHSQADVTRKRLDRAGKLTSALADEGVRWKVRGQGKGSWAPHGVQGQQASHSHAAALHEIRSATHTTHTR